MGPHHHLPDLHGGGLTVVEQSGRLLAHCHPGCLWDEQSVREVHKAAAVPGMMTSTLQKQPSRRTPLKAAECTACAKVTTERLTDVLAPNALPGTWQMDARLSMSRPGGVLGVHHQAG